MTTGQFNNKRKLFVTMKKLLYCCCGLLVATVSMRATPLFSDNFNSYPNGNLVGNDGWTQQSTTTTSPIQVSSGRALVGATGQDIFNTLSTPYTLVDGTSFYIGATLNLSAATATGDYFLHWGTLPQGNTFMSRVFVKSSGTGYVLGYLETSGTGTTTYGTTVLNFGQDYRMVLAYNPVAGPLNDTAAVYVDPDDLTVEANNTPYLSDTWTTTTAEQTTLATINLRQGGSTSGPTLAIDDLGLATTFAEAATFTPAPVPEPTSLSLLGGFGLLAWFVNRRRR